MDDLFRERTLINPFPPLSSTATGPSLDEVAERLSLVELSDTRRRDLASAVRRAAELFGEPLSAVPADMGELRRRLNELRPARHDLSPKTVSNIRTNLKAAVEVSGLAPVLKTANVPLSPEWKVLVAEMPNRRTREGLSRFGRFCSLNGIGPDVVDSELLAHFGKALRSSTLVMRADAIVRDVATLWNRLADQRPDRGLARLELASRRHAPTRVAWDILPDSFMRDMEEHLAWAGGADPFAQDARPRPLSPGSVHLRRQQIHAAVTSLIASGVSAEEIASLSDLVTPEAYKRILRHRHQEASGEANAFNDGLAKALVAIAREWVKPDAATVAELKRLRSKLPSIGSGLTEKNKALLRTFDDDDLKARLLFLSETLWHKALKRAPSSRRLADAQAALAIEILLHAPLRVSNLTALEFGRTLFLARGNGAKSLIEIPAAEMKARESHKAELPAHLTAMLRVYKDEMLEPLLGRKATHLFDNGRGKPKLETTISWLIKRTVDRHLGITMTSQQFRHVTSKFTLDANPGGLHLVTANLGHRSPKTTLNYYAGLDTRRAGRFLADLVEQERAKAKQNQRGPRRFSSRKKRP